MAVKVKTREDFEISLDWAEELVDDGAVSDEFTILLISQMRRRFDSGTDCTGCYKQMELINEKLETGSFPWEREMNRLQIDVSDLKNHLDKIKKARFGNERK